MISNQYKVISNTFNILEECFHTKLKNVALAC